MAGSVNRVILIGRLGKDPEVKYTQSGQALTRFSLATDDRRKDEQGNWVDQTEWHNIICFGKTAENAGEYLKKGSQIYLEGKIRYRSWDDKESGQKKYMTEIHTDRIQFLDSAKDRGVSTSAGGTHSPSSQAHSPTSAPEPRMEDGEDLPF